MTKTKDGHHFHLPRMEAQNNLRKPECENDESTLRLPTPFQRFQGTKYLAHRSGSFRRRRHTHHADNPYKTEILKRLAPNDGNSYGCCTTNDDIQGDVHCVVQDKMSSSHRSEGQYLAQNQCYFARKDFEAVMGILAEDGIEQRIVQQQEDASVALAVFLTPERPPPREPTIEDDITAFTVALKAEVSEAEEACRKEDASLKVAQHLAAQDLGYFMDVDASELYSIANKWSKEL